MIRTHQDLRDLFTRHCACTPCNVSRSADDHVPACVTGVLDDVQRVLRGERGSLEAYEAVKRCDRYARGDYTPLCGRRAL